MIFVAQLVMMAADLFVNVFAEFWRAQFVVILVLFIFQGLIQVINLLIAFLMLTNTQMFKAGIVGVMFKKFRWTFGVSGLYFLLTVALRIYQSNIMSENNWYWDGAFIPVFILHR